MQLYQQKALPHERQLTAGLVFDLGLPTGAESRFQGGRTRSETNRAGQEVLAERSRLATTEQQVMFDAGTAYVDVQRDDAVDLSPR